RYIIIYKSKISNRMRIKNKKIDEFFKKLPVSKNYETKIILNRAFLQKEKEQYGVYCSFEIKI
ncbi:MAG: hypothetical protein WAX58_03890, partial [Ruminococcus bromii]